MKNNKLIRGINYFFSFIGVVFVTCTIFLFFTNMTGIITLFSVIGLVETQSLYNIDTAAMIKGATAGIVDSLNDPYSKYLDKETWEEFKIRLEAKFGGIGVYVLRDDQGRLKIVSPIPGTPAYKAGLKHGDIIIRINGENATGMSQDEAVHLMRGDPGTQLQLGIYRESEGREYDFKIIREIINVPSVEDKIIDNGYRIGYIRLNQFHSRSAREMSDSLNKMLEQSKIEGLVLDLRDNGGGDFEAAVSIAGIFLDDKEIVSVVDAQGNKTVHRASPGKLDIPMVVLVNQNSASASEILAGALQDNKRAQLVGEKTYGKGLVQTIYSLYDGGALKLTTQKYFTPDGTDINEIGITPDYVVKNDPNTQKDMQLEKALQILRELLS
ncbi:MAG: S41 family peptidase [Syntrophomonadaceae bacterium]|nr:S41 family peptidase [Syntrophomonadaceae bacterium]